MVPASKEPRPSKLIERHPPERGESRRRYVIVYSCCCCCCCCLHSVGAAIGAAVVGNYRADPTKFTVDLALDPSAAKADRGPSTQIMYWTSFAIALLIGLVAFMGYFFFERSEAPTGGAATSSLLMVGATIVLFGPLWLLAASVVMAVRLALTRNLPNPGRYWAHLGYITLGMIAGSFAGTMVMVVAFTILA